MVRINLVILCSISVLTGSLMHSLGCATNAPVTSAGIRKDMAVISQEIAANRSTVNMLKDKRVGKSGFYYVVDSEGTVVFHPQSALIGSSFSKIWFINQLLAEKSGCLTYPLGNRMFYLFFSPINDSEILCLSIVSDDLQQPGECKAAEVKSAD